MSTKVKSSRKIVLIALSLVILMTSFVSLPTLKASALTEQEIDQILECIINPENYLNSEDENIKKLAEETEGTKLLDYMEEKSEQDKKQEKGTNGGHTLARHVQDESYLQKRIETEMVNEYKKYLVRECIKDESLIRDLNEDTKKYLQGDIKDCGLNIEKVVIKNDETDQMLESLLNNCVSQIDKSIQTQKMSLYSKIDDTIKNSYTFAKDFFTKVNKSENLKKYRWLFDGILTNGIIDNLHDFQNEQNDITTSVKDIFKKYQRNLENEKSELKSSEEKTLKKECIEKRYSEIDRGDLLRFYQILSYDVKSKEILENITKLLEIKKGINTLIEKKEEINNYIGTQYKDE